MADEAGVSWDRSLLAAHHPEGERHRCAVVRGRPVCRRCLVLYPLLLAVLTAAAAGLLAAVPTGARNAWLWLLPLPAALEYSAEAFGLVRYEARRQVAVTVLQAMGGGAGFAWELLEPGTVTFWQAVLLYGCTAVTVTAMGWRVRADKRARARYQQLLDEAERRIDSMA
ncbi:MAG: hypothetical protein IT196_18035 [Acidimicrobiales bacterium]|nr:hypothetical protein [Acidimicrobiales bacterium]